MEMNPMYKMLRLVLRVLLLTLMLQEASAAIPVQQWTQPSGLRVYLVENPAIAMVDLQIDFDAGSRRDPPTQAGLASATAAMAAKGLLPGAEAADTALDENGLSEAWADLGATFGASISADRMSFWLRSLAYPDLLARAVQLASRQLGEPAFPDAVWQRERERLGASIRESATRPASVAARAFAEAVYRLHPYGLQTTEASLAAIGVADMRALYRRLIVPCRASVSIVGAVTREQADAMVRKLFARRVPAGGAGCPAPDPVPEVAALAQAQEIRIAFDSAQSHLLIGQPGFKRNDPDFFALTLGNHILGGGGFVSRLTQEVREKRGLSYSVYSYFSPALHAGAFTIGLQTRPDQAAQALAVSREVLERFVAQGPTQAELDAAKSNLIGGFALRIDSNRKLLDNIGNIAWNDLALDYLETWTREVQAVSLNQVRAAMARKLQPARMVTVLVGPAP